MVTESDVPAASPIQSVTLRPRIAVIRLGALGDVIQALGPMRTIREHHRNASITLITTKPYADFLAASGYGDVVWSDGRPRGVGDTLAFLARFRRARFTWVYDLQTSGRTSWYHASLWPRWPKWSGVAPFASHPHTNRARVSQHTIERQAEQLAQAGIAPVLPPDVSWAKADLAGLVLPPRYALLVPGGSAHRPQKRWPVERFAGLAVGLAARGIACVVIGGEGEAGLAARIGAEAPGTIDLTGRTDLFTLATLGRGASLAVGNDTGPMHLFAVAGAPCLVLFSHASDPARCGQRGRAVRFLRVGDLSTLDPSRVLEDALDLAGAAADGAEIEGTSNFRY